MSAYVKNGPGDPNRRNSTTDVVWFTTLGRTLKECDEAAEGIAAAVFEEYTLYANGANMVSNYEDEDEQVRMTWEGTYTALRSGVGLSVPLKKDSVV